MEKYEKDFYQPMLDNINSSLDITAPAKSAINYAARMDYGSEFVRGCMIFLFKNRFLSTKQIEKLNKCQGKYERKFHRLNLEY